jgi:DNA-binding response OmpR family regulator
MKILLVEDHPRIRENISIYMRRENYTVDEAKNGEE